jgi:hypothetical protein
VNIPVRSRVERSALKVVGRRYPYALPDDVGGAA